MKVRPEGEKNLGTPMTHRFLNCDIHVILYYILYILYTDRPIESLIFAENRFPRKSQKKKRKRYSPRGPASFSSLSPPLDVTSSEFRLIPRLNRFHGGEGGGKSRDARVSLRLGRFNPGVASLEFRLDSRDISLRVTFDT